MSAGLLPLKSKLEYSIASWSSHSASYHPKHILVDNPKDQSSRWSSGSNNQKKITFGKYHKMHVCNLKEFKVFAGLDQEHMTEILHSGLRNDSEPETFNVDFLANRMMVPCQYIKIVPLLAWGANFNFSVWYVELTGISDPAYVRKCYQEFNQYREATAIRLCLKHLRQRNYLNLFETIQSETSTVLEHPFLSELHKELVLNGNFDKAEEILSESFQKSLFQEYVGSLPYKPKWIRINGGEEYPCARGGHQMCIDPDAGIIYLYGGWDGNRDLSDFWAYFEETGEWKCLSMDTRRQGGPDPRSCHKLCLDPNEKALYTLGKYVDPECRPNTQLDSDFWKYEIKNDKWVRLSTNTAIEGGPELIYDHQMIIDHTQNTLYVYGGRTISPDPSQITYSGLYCWYIKEKRWKLVYSDKSTARGSDIKSRIGHSMLFNPLTRELYIFAGQRHKDFLADFYVYDIEKDVFKEITRDYSKNGGPDAGFTQRATIDHELGEFYLLSGIMREKSNGSETKNALWVYSIERKKWTKVYENENLGSEFWAQNELQEPRPRFAHQLVYDPIRKCQFLFGGNPGETAHPNLRLNDFWKLHLTRPTSGDILRRAQFLIRKQYFIELSQTNDKKAALKYLQTIVSKVVNHDDEIESKAFRDLAQYLFIRKPFNGTAIDAPPSSGGMAIDEPTQPDVFTLRAALYENLLSYFPISMREPKANLVDLVPMN